MLRPPLRLLYFTVRAPPRSATAQSPRLREHPVFTRTPLNWGPRAAAAGIRLRECARKWQNERLPLANNSHTPDATRTFDSLKNRPPKQKTVSPVGGPYVGAHAAHPLGPASKLFAEVYTFRGYHPHSARGTEKGCFGSTHRK